MKKIIFFRVVIVGIFLWCVICPFFLAHHVSYHLEVTYLSVLYLYSPEFIFSIYCLLVLPCIWVHKKWALYALWIGVIFLPLLQYTTSKLTYGPWLIVLFLLALLSWLFYTARV